MHNTKKFLLLIFISLTQSERWYSATIKENGSLFEPKRDLIHTTTLLPLVIEKEDFLNKWHPRNSSGDVYNYPNLKNNTMTYYKAGRPRRKLIKKRCPVGPRKSKQDYKYPKSRFLEVFEVVEFHHENCFSSSGLEGTCRHEYDCQTSGGIPMDSCADNYGICCVNQLSCDENTSVSTSWFVNPGFPSTSSERLSCAITVQKASPDIKQIRLDFLHFELLPPTAGTCELDQFVVSGQNINSMIPILCGTNGGQHIYIDVGDVVGPITLSIMTVSEETRLFAIKIAQLTASDPLKAPSGCLQYFNGQHGYLQSFNYHDRSDTSIPKIPSYLNNLNYAMCIERAFSSCSITYSNADNLQIVNYDTDGLPILPPTQAGVEIFNCPTDWLLIAAVRLCGDRLNDGSVLQDFSLNAPITDVAVGPIVVWFRSDGVYVGKGFKLQFQQNSCTS